MRRLLRPLIAALAAVAGLFAIMATTGAFGGSDGGVASAASPAQQIGMRVLLITDSTIVTRLATVSAYNDWVNTLKREGVPTTRVVTNDASVGSVPLPTLSSTASDGTQVANYEGVIVATSGTEGMSTAQWTTLQTFEQQFSVRQLTAYAVPSSDYGLAHRQRRSAASARRRPSPVLTSDGATVFPYLNKVGLRSGHLRLRGRTRGRRQREALSTGPHLRPRARARCSGIYTTPDGRQTMFQTFNENQFMLQSELLRHGELDWLGRNTYFGDQRNYLETDIDDNFLSDDAGASPATPPRAALDRLQPGRRSPRGSCGRHAGGNLVQGQQLPDRHAVQRRRQRRGRRRRQPRRRRRRRQRRHREHRRHRGHRARVPIRCWPPSRQRTRRRKAVHGDFGWISHTWDHPNIDEGCATRTTSRPSSIRTPRGAPRPVEHRRQSDHGGLGLTSSTDPTAALGTDNPQVVVTGEHSGLANLLPGNPGQVDPPALDDATRRCGATSTLRRGRLRLRGQRSVQHGGPGGDRLWPAPVSPTASISSPVTVAAGQSVT